MGEPKLNQTSDQVLPAEPVQALDFRNVERLNPGADRSRLSALDLARGIAIMLMVTSHSIKGLLTFEQMPPWGIMPVHAATKFSSSLFFLVFGISLSLFFLPYTGTVEWPKKRKQLLWRSVQLMIAYKILTVVQMYMTYSTEFIIDTLLFKRFPDFVEVLGFYSFCLLWIPFVLPLWRNMPLFSKVATTLGLAIGGFVLNLAWDFGGYTILKAILVEESGHFTFGQMQRGAVVLFGMLLGDFFNFFRGNAYRDKYMALLLFALGGASLVFFYQENQHDLYNTLYAIGKNHGKHPPTVAFMTFSLGGALVILGFVFMAGRWLPKLLTPITVMGQSPLFSFYFHIIIIFIFFRDLYGLHHKTTYEFSWVLTGFLLLMTSGSAAASARIQADMKKAKGPKPQVFVAMLMLLLAPCAFAEGDKDGPGLQWNQRFQAKAVSIAKAFDGEVGIYIKDLDTGLKYSMNADTPWYLASNVKLLVLIEVLRKIDKKELNYTDPIQIQKHHYRDGSGQTNWIEPGQSVSLHFLMEQMMIESDNAATDILIDLVGLEPLNEGIREFVPTGLNYITSLLMVRIMAFGEMHPRAKGLTNHDFIALKRVKDEKEKTKKLAELIGVSPKELKISSIGDAFERYYERGLNSATLVSYGELLEKIALGKVLSPERSQEVVELMRRCYTGKDRLIAGLSKKYKLAHKTGTQMRRACDMGIVMHAERTKKDKKVVLAVCTQKFKSSSVSNDIFRKIGEAFSESGVMEEPALTRAPTAE